VVCGLFEHRCKSEKISARRLVHDDFLLIFVHRGDPHLPGNHHVRLTVNVTPFIDAFPLGKIPKLDLSGEHGGLIIIEQGK
jgi:hypothetical protein